MPPRSQKNPCFSMRDTGRCQSRDRCPYSHDIAAVGTRSGTKPERVKQQGHSKVSAGSNAQPPQRHRNSVPTTSSSTSSKPTASASNSSNPRPNARSQTSGHRQSERTDNQARKLQHIEQERLRIEREKQQRRKSEERERQRILEAEARERQRVAEQQAKARRETELRELERRRQQAEEAKRRRQAEQNQRRVAEERERQRRAEEAAAKARQQMAELERQRRAAEDRERQRLVAEAAAKARQQTKLEEQAADILQTVVSGSIVTFSAGLAVQHVVTGFECCKILVRNLPQNVRNEEIVGLLARYGLDAQHFHVTDRRRIADKLELSIIAQADAANQLRAGADELELRGEPLDVEFGVFNGVGGMGGGAEGRSVLRAIFFAPAARFIATYSDHETAERYFRELQDQNLGGRAVRLSRGREGNALLLNNIPLSYLTKTEAVAEFAHTLLIRALPSAVTDIDVAIRRIETHVEQASFGVHCEVVSRGNDRGGLVRLLFACPSWEVAKQLGDRLQAFAAVGDFQRLKLRATIPPAVRFTMLIPSGQYRAQQTQWKDLDSGIKDRKACFLEFRELNRGDHRVEVAGIDKQAVGRLKVQAERIAAGTRVPGWHPSLARPSPRLLEQVTLVGAFLKSDPLQQTIKLYGPNEAIAAALELVEAELERFAATAQTVSIPPFAARFFIREGVDQLKALLDDDTIAYNAASRKVSVKGDEVARRTVQRLIEHAVSWVAPASGSAEDLVCNICFDTPTAPRTMFCGHAYCTGCLRHLFSSVSDGSSLPVRCMGDEAQCTSHFPIALIREFVAPAAFDDLLVLAFATHTDRHPEAFRHCATPDCNQLYRPQSIQQKLNCPSCCTIICAKCNEDWHDGKSCEQAKQANNKDEQEKLTEEYFRGQRVVKRCPSCKTPIFKTEGCNHITCKCGVHFCWRCLVVTTRDRIYDHMQEVHGGMHEPDPPPPPPPPIPTPAPAPAPTIAPTPARGLPNANNAPPYGQQVRAPVRPAYYDPIDESDDDDDPANPFLGVDYREQQELLRQAALNRDRAQAARREQPAIAVHTFGQHVWREPLAAPVPRPVVQPAVRPAVQPAPTPAPRPAVVLPVVRPVVPPAAWPVVQPVVRPVPQPPAVRPVVAQPAVRAVVQPTIRQVVQTIPAPVPRPVVAQPAVRPIAQPVAPQYNQHRAHQPVPHRQALPSYGTVPHEPPWQRPADNDNSNDGCCCVVM